MTEKERVKPLKIALIGSAPSSVHLAPYESEDWVIWACSGSVYPVARRTDAWFEVHNYEPNSPRFSEGYCNFLANYPNDVWMTKTHPAIPNAQELPTQELIEKYSPYFFTSTLAWMFAMAIEMGADTIGLWGVDMAAQGEYGYQRAGLQHFALLAKAKGINVGVPPQSDLFRPSAMYGLSEHSQQHQKYMARRYELEERHHKLEMEIAQKNQELWFLKGAIDDMSYHEENWLGDPRSMDQEFCTVPFAPGMNEPAPKDFPLYVIEDGKLKDVVDG